jgi:hypothetical protein
MLVGLPILLICPVQSGRPVHSNPDPTSVVTLFSGSTTHLPLFTLKTKSGSGRICHSLLIGLNHSLIQEVANGADADWNPVRQQHHAWLSFSRDA